MWATPPYSYGRSDAIRPQEDAMDPLGVLANEYVRRLSDAQFAEPPRHRRREQAREVAVARRRAARWRRTGRAVRRVAETLLS